MSKYCDYCSEEAVHHWCASCVVDPRVAELEHIAELAMEWSAKYPPGKRSFKTNERIANRIYDACEQAGIGQAEKDKKNE